MYLRNLFPTNPASIIPSAVKNFYSLLISRSTFASIHNSKPKISWLIFRNGFLAIDSWELLATLLCPCRVGWRSRMPSCCLSVRSVGRLAGSVSSPRKSCRRPRTALYTWAWAWAWAWTWAPPQRGVLLLLYIYFHSCGNLDGHLASKKIHGIGWDDDENTEKMEINRKEQGRKFSGKKKYVGVLGGH